MFCVKCGKNLLPMGTKSVDSDETVSKSSVSQAATQEDFVPEDSSTIKIDNDEPASVKAKMTVIGLTEDDSRFLLETLCQAWGMQETLREKAQTARRNTFLRSRSKQKVVAASIAAPVALAVGLLVLFIGFRHGMTAGHFIIAAVLEIIALFAMIYGVVFVAKMRRIDCVGEIGDSYVEYCENKDSRISEVIGPLVNIIPLRCRSKDFAVSLLHDFHDRNLDFDSVFLGHDKYGILPQVSEDGQIDIDHDVIAAIRSKLSEIDDSQFETMGEKPESRVILFALIPLLTPLLGVMIAVVLCVTVVTNMKVYLGGRDEYPSYVIQNVMTETYRGCSQHAVYYPKSLIPESSSIIYRPLVQTILLSMTISNSLNKENAEKDEALASCVYEQLGGSNISGKEAADFFNRVALSGVNLDNQGMADSSRGKAYYIKNKNITIVGTSTGIAGAFMMGVGYGHYVENPEPGDAFLKSVRAEEMVDSLDALNEKLPDLPTLPDFLQDDGAANQKEDLSSLSQNDSSSDDGGGTVSNVTPDDGVFNDLWNSVVEGQNMTELAGTYCRNDGNCISLSANPNYIPSSYGENFPGILSFVSGSSSPLPNGDAQSDLGFQYQSDPGLPSAKIPIAMTAGCQASAGCPDGSQSLVYFVIAGTGLDFFQQEYVSIPTDSGNPPDSSRDYLAIAGRNGPTISNDTVYYREG